MEDEIPDLMPSCHPTNFASDGKMTVTYSNRCLALLLVVLPFLSTRPLRLSSATYSSTSASFSGVSAVIISCINPFKVPFAPSIPQKVKWTRMKALHSLRTV